MATNTRETIEKRARTRCAHLDAVTAQLHAEYMEGASFYELAKRHNRDRRGIRSLFEKRRLFIRPWETPSGVKRVQGAFVAAPPLTAEQLDELIRTSTRICVPQPLKHEWRHWSLQRRGDFLARMRAHVARAGDRPTLPFSSNVEPFDYSTQRAHDIAAQINVGLDSRQAKLKIKAPSQGVIFNGQLWFWVEHTGYVRGPWTKEDGRPCLHHTIWKATHGRKVPRAHVIRFADGNPNNLAPENLVLASRNDVARENQAAALFRKARAKTALLLGLAQTKEPNEHNDIITGLNATGGHRSV